MTYVLCALEASHVVRGQIEKVCVRDYPTIPWVLYIMVMFKRYGQLLSKTPSLSEKEYATSFSTGTFISYYIIPLFSYAISDIRRCPAPPPRILDPQN